MPKRRSPGGIAARLAKPRSPNTIERAIEAYGEDPDDPTLRVFAAKVAQGLPSTKAYQAIRPDANESTASVESSRLMAHPKIRKWVAQHALGAPMLARSLAPEMVAKLHEVATGEKVDPKVAVSAANSLLDRGGLPRSSHVAVDVRAEYGEAIEGLAADEPPEVQEAEVVDDEGPPEQPQPHGLPPALLEATEAMDDPDSQPPDTDAFW